MGHLSPAMHRTTADLRPDPGLALCLSSSFFGYYAHLGLLAGLEERGLSPGRIAGASAGAMAGGLWAAGLRGAALQDMLFDPRFLRAFYEPGILVRGVGVLTGLAGSGFLSGRRMRRYLLSRLGEQRIEDLRNPRLEIAVSNLNTALPEIRDHGPLADFMVASCAIPVLFQAQEIGGESFVDGGVANESPFDHWLDDPTVHSIVVHRIRRGADRRASRRWTPFGVVAACHGLAAEELQRRRREQAERSGKRLLFLETIHERPRVWHGDRARGYFAAGRKTAREAVLSM